MDSQELVLLFKGFHHDVDELNVAVAHGSPNLVRCGTSSPSAPVTIRWFLLQLPVVLVNALQQLRPVKAPQLLALANVTTSQGIAVDGKSTVL